VRIVTGSCVLAAGGAHVWSYVHGYRSTSVGPAFVVDAVASVLVGSSLLVRGGRVSAWAGTTLAAAALFSYGMARTVGLFGFVERSWTVASLVAAGCEAVVVTLLVTELLVTEPLVADT
jgi:hypothetical protein